VAAQRNTRNNKQAEQKSLPWGPMFLSFAVGLFVMFLIHLNDNVEPQASHSSSTEQAKKPSNTIEPTFEFYTLLPEMEVVVNSSPRPQSQTSQQEKKPEISSKEDKNTYLLQVGSFRKLSDADGFKAKLAFLGIESKVQTVTIDNKDTWHRVQVGPIIGRVKADAVKTQLKKNKIDSLLVRTKHG